MGIVASSYTVGVPQKDGQVYVTEHFEDQLGNKRDRTYGPVPPTTDFAALLAERVARINIRLKKTEIRRMIEHGFYAPEYQTVDEAAALLLEMYQNSERENRAQIAIAVLDSISKGVITDTKWANTFGLTSQQWDNIKTNKLQPLADAYSLIRGAVG